MNNRMVDGDLNFLTLSGSGALVVTHDRASGHGEGPKTIKKRAPTYTKNRPASAKRRTINEARKTLTKKIVVLFEALGPHVAKTLSRLGKAEDDDLEKALRELDLSSLAVISASTMQENEAIYSDAGRQALAILGVADNSQLINQVSEDAVAYARDRAAYLVGKRVLEDGSIVDNPDAEYAITDTTRSMLRDLISERLTEGVTSDQLASAIEGASVFSEERARMIAYTEVGNANSAGVLSGFRSAVEVGINVLKQWQTAGDGCCDDCDQNEAQGPIPLDDTFQSGDDAPLAHPNCQCVLLSVTEDEQEEDDADETD